jgi:hypothetical protein
MAKILHDRACAICQKPIPAGSGAFRRGISFVHVECANKTEKDPPPTQRRRNKARAEGS